MDFEGLVGRETPFPEPEMQEFADFALSLRAGEDEQAGASVQYWFHVPDYDGDGVIDTADMRYFYEEQQRRLEAMGEEVVSLEELLNEFNDMIAPATPSRIRLAELQRKASDKLHKAIDKPSTP